MTRWPDGYDRVIHDRIDSTNAEARRRLADSPGQIWILAKEQTAGVGRRGRGWSSEQGNFSATLLMPLNGPLKDAALYSFVAALSLYDAFVECGVSQKDIGLKWPNDVLLKGGKVAGILLETAGKNTSYLCIGIGVNLAHAPHIKTLEPNAVPPKSLAIDVNIDVSPELFLQHLACHFADRKQQFLQAGFDAIRRDWLSKATGVGNVITARTIKQETIGRFDTVDETGALVLNTTQGPKRITAADIFFAEE